MSKKEWLLDIIGGKIAKLGDPELTRLHNLSESAGEGKAYAQYIGEDWIDQVVAVAEQMKNGTYVRPA